MSSLEEKLERPRHQSNESTKARRSWRSIQSLRGLLGPRWTALEWGPKGEPPLRVSISIMGETSVWNRIHRIEKDWLFELE